MLHITQKDTERKASLFVNLFNIFVYKKGIKQN